MSTTVTYKGTTIATVSGETKKLTTKGKWLEDDISITETGEGGIDGDNLAYGDGVALVGSALVGYATAV